MPCRARYPARFIPAHAGNTPSAFMRSSACGGSSPRTRGTRWHSMVRRQIVRFIPAHAGNTSVSVIRPLPQPVHPRARGEHCAREPPTLPSDGSSPRTRGTPATPALPSCRSAVHPRARGEHEAFTSIAAEAAGSSPRTRGTRLLRPFLCRCDRFIPAHAGNTQQPRVARELEQVHPRARGEHGAGAAACPPCAPVHPRARGEHFSPATMTRSARGSSPRTRGTRWVIDGFTALVSGSSPRTRGTPN